VRALFGILACLTLAAAPQPAIKQFNVRVPMRDGVQLAANIFRPVSDSRVPAILVRTPYGKGDSITDHYQTFVNHGYAVVVQDVRGRHDSEGTFKPLEQEPNDGSDTIDWIARQAWCDGKIGMMGGSYLGIVQWKVAVLNNRHLKAIFPVVSGYDDYRDRFYSTGGALKLGNRLNWMSENLRVPEYRPVFSKFVLHLPLRTSDVAATGQTSEMYQQALRHPAFDSFWRSVSTREQIAKIKVPVFSVGGWYDNFVQSDLEAFAALSRSSGVHRILIGPWPHNMSIRFPAVDYGKAAEVPVRSLQLQWFDQWLKGKDTPLISKPPVRIFTMGVNEWHEERSWPPEGMRPVTMYFEGHGRANTLDGDGGLNVVAPRREYTDRFVYDPRDPVPTRGGAVCCNPVVFPWGPMDQRPIERRKDVLVYTSKPLHREVEATGPVQVVLFAATTAKDTDFTAKLVDVFPDGQARNLTDGILRMRYRKSLEREDLATPGEVMRLVIDAGVTSNVFLKGHRIRLEISSSNFPRFDRNPNTGAPIGSDARLTVATQTVYHGKDRNSHLVLPVVERRAPRVTIRKAAQAPVP
jgi:putative CocE/NonD family hydrolase